MTYMVPLMMTWVKRPLRGVSRERLDGLENSRDEAVGDRVTEWYKHQRHKGGNGVADIRPVDCDNLTHHHAPNLDGQCLLVASVWKLTKINVHPVAQGGIEAKIGAKKIETIKQSPVVTAASPVLPPSAIPEPDSINAVTGDRPRRLPMEMLKASVQYAIVDRGKSPFAASATPAKRAML
jgi:hypothetical protein